MLCVSEKPSIQRHTKPKSESPVRGGQLALDVSLSQEVAALACVGEEKHLAPSAPAEFP